MHYAKYKTILSQNNHINVYRGCSHGCIYCDSRSKCYQMNHDFEDIEVKQDAAIILEDQIRRKRNKCMISTGAMTDPYIHLEEDLKVTRRCLEVIDKYDFGLAIQTKSTRILRDVDILKRINDKTKCVVQITLTTYHDKLCKIIEPNVSTSFERFEILKVMQKERIPTVVWLSPILPFINDTKENLLGILEYCLEAGVYAIIGFGFGLTLREGNREYFYKKLGQHFPQLKEKYIQYYGDSYGCISPNNLMLMKVIREFCQKHNILFGNQKVFNYLKEFEPNRKQMSIF